MAGGSGDRTLEETATWAVAVVCFVLVVISIIIEHIIHIIGKWLTKKNRPALSEALEKVKLELMLLGFISLLLTILQDPISEICISESAGNYWLPCSKARQKEMNTDYKGGKEDSGKSSDSDHGRKLLMFQNSVAGVRRRLAAAAGSDNCAAKNKVPLVSYDALYQLHKFIFVLAVFHVFHCVITMTLGKAKMSRWKVWEKETRTEEYQFSHYPERFRFARETSFGRRHLTFWSKSPILLWIMCFFRQFFKSLPKVDYLTLRHGFITAHLAPESETRFNFQKYIARSLEEDFKVVVGISPIIWFVAVVSLLFNAHGFYTYLWLPFIPLIIILLLGTKLQMIVTEMGLKIQERGEVVRGDPVVQPGDNLFWFNRPHHILYLIHFVLFQNSFQLAFFAWTWFTFGYPSCFHEHLEDVIIRISMGVIVLFLGSYVTLPLYALVTQMGSTMKPTIFNETVATGLKKWHHTARKHVKENRISGNASPISSRPTTPTHGMSPVHLLHHYRSEVDTFEETPKVSDDECSDIEASPSQPQHMGDGSLSYHDGHISPVDQQERATHNQPHQATQDERVVSMNFSFRRNRP